jgi:hypothetical protein
MIDHDLGLKSDRVTVTFDIPPQLFLRLLGVELRVILNLLHQLVVALDRREILEHIEDEALVDCLFHRVAVKRLVLDLALGVRRQCFAEHLQGFILGRRGES